MDLRGSITLIVATVALAGTGCVSCPKPACHKAVYEAGPTCEVPRGCRDRVYTFLVNGVNPWGSNSLDELEACMHRHGFCKVGRAGVLHGGWLVGEMKRIRESDPDARFVLVGYDAGAATAMRTATKAVEADIPIDALVLLDPIGPSLSKMKHDIRTVLIRSGGGTVMVPQAEIVPVPEADHFDLPGKTTTMAAVCGVLEEVGLSIWSELPNHVRYPSWMSDDSPTGAFAPSRTEDTPSEWNFLHERVGGVTTPLSTEESH